jgi:hypothetical protein
MIHLKVAQKYRSVLSHQLSAVGNSDRSFILRHYLGRLGNMRRQ